MSKLEYLLIKVNGEKGSYLTKVESFVYLPIPKTGGMDTTNASPQIKCTCRVVRNVSCVVKYHDCLYRTTLSHRIIAIATRVYKLAIP